MLFQGEEYGERAPFQFFSDHIDEEIATATRDGRLREFAQFEAFAGQVPDPQDPATFERSKLSRRGRPGAARALRAAARGAPRRSARAEAEPAFDEALRWLSVRRGDARAGDELRPTRSAACRSTASEVVLATHDGVRLEDGFAVLPPLAGALVR